MKKNILAEKAPQPIGPYNQAVLAGKFLFVSGQLAIDPKSGKIVADEVALQTRQVMETQKQSWKLQVTVLKTSCNQKFIFLP